jgi:hypothetical protein
MLILSIMSVRYNEQKTVRHFNTKSSVCKVPTTLNFTENCSVFVGNVTIITFVVAELCNSVTVMHLYAVYGYPQLPFILTPKRLYAFAIAIITINQYYLHRPDTIPTQRPLVQRIPYHPYTKLKGAGG